jgi:hypothetical protein
MERTGRPSSLVCTKNHASDERRVQQRTADLAALARLDDCVMCWQPQARRS